ncbi:4Fe-4S ferredoxin with iron-sulfur binding domain [Gottschalkia acidurici 9a]|uniref:4Fe-4S ferredoxin with iron-sulfur binding domain n=1 Tax=Gottschalkia acidurici (strain ATCC 7906 / DSM 604 / BCRC 14475 / CIP 104303 / KCTC 5404 / NCIMB 10678 / 9a) TaxID=1128398 RepID=K0B1G1_GOTA9|nr:EFR1 family ferrodoxin [Gottschalkia acidurici]AFS78800.1 4Fe-4S ferredoxin with iron-sulfur binding domain [Gottschalkia acidurici 9a]
MKIEKIVSIYFSPNGGTKKVVNEIAKNIKDLPIEEIDLTIEKNRNIEREFSKNELVVFGMPVYADRLPNISKEIFKKIKGNGNLAVCVVTYGNRDYGDALLELKNELNLINMSVIAAVAAISQHCLNKNVATNRPDENDFSKLINFSNLINEKIEDLNNISNLKDLSIKGNFPYKPLKEHHVPIGDSSCIKCGVCEKNCPVNAIDKIDFKSTNKDICIFCGKCINICPVNSRAIQSEEFKAFMKKLELIAKDRKEMSIFI